MFTDSMNAAIISRKGSMSLRLRQLAIQIYQFCARHGVTLEVEWIPRSFNYLADTISRIRDFDDRSTSDAFFTYINSISGPFDVDRFASCHTAKCIRFYSKF